MRFYPMLPALFAVAVSSMPSLATAQSDQCATTRLPTAAVLTPQEIAEGWRVLWDGTSNGAWRGVNSEQFPQHGWQACNGILTVQGKGGEESRGGGDIITRKRYADFDLKLDVMIAAGANSGVKIFTQPKLTPIDRLTGKPAAVGSAIGLEFQVLDDERHPDAKAGRDGNRTIGSLYDLIAARKDKKASPVGDWNQVRILSQGKHVTFWLNGEKTVEFERGSPAFRAAAASSKFRDIPGFGEWADGHILLQDHGDQVSFRNIVIRELRAK